MKRRFDNMRRLALLAMMLPLSLAALNLGRSVMTEVMPAQANKDTLSQKEVEELKEYADSLMHVSFDMRNMARIYLTARSYGDSIVLRWAGEDYAVQRVLDAEGVDIIRTDLDSKDHEDVVLVEHFKPWSKQQFLDFYPKEDSLAMMAYGIMYGGKEMRPDQTRNAPGTLGAIVELSENQKQHHMFAVLISEWRRDLANHMAMRWVDRDVIPGHEYSYAIVPSTFDAEGPIPIASASTRLVNEKFVQPDFNAEIGDSIIMPFQFRLWWNPQGMSSFEIQRRRLGHREWTNLTNIPFLNMQTDNGPETLNRCAYADIVDSVGYYEYRVIGHDPFGDLTKPSPVHRAFMPDLMGPKAPELTWVEIDRQDPNDLSKQVMATFHFEKDTIEDDFIGFMPMYYNEKQTKKKWKNLSDKLLSATDTVFTCDMTGFSSGMVVVAAYDTAQNVSYSMPRMVNIKDVKAPAMMRNFKAEPNLEDGTVTLTWEPDPADDDIEYYEVSFANDTTHSFALKTQGKLTECRYVDTLAMDVNQKYIYYKVRAIDYSTNQGVETPALQVLRPSRLKPSKAHLLESDVDSLGIHMVWACSNEQIMDRHILLRRLEGSETWDTLGVYSADSIKLEHNRLTYTDVPAYNRTKEYQYCVESFTCFDISSGHSLIACFKFKGKRVFQTNLELKGEHDKAQNLTHLSWECELPVSDEWYYCLYRKDADDEQPQFIISVPSDRKDMTTRRVPTGEQSEFYIKIRYKDGRESNASNTVTVKAEPQP